MYLVYFSTYKLDIYRLSDYKLSDYKLSAYKNTLPTVIDNVRMKSNLHFYSSRFTHLPL